MTIRPFALFRGQVLLTKSFTSQTIYIITVKFGSYNQQLLKGLMHF